MSAEDVRRDLLSEVEMWKAATKREAHRADEALRMAEEHTRRANARLEEVEAERDRLRAIAAADIEALVSAGLLALAEKEGQAFLALSNRAANLPTQKKRAVEDLAYRAQHRAACLREMSLAVSLGQFRTAECNEKAIVAAHREAAGFNPSKAGGEARSRALSPEQRTEIARRGAVLRFWEPTCKHGTDAMVTLDGDVWCHICQKLYQRKPARARWAAKKGE